MAEMKEISTNAEYRKAVMDGELNSTPVLFQSTAEWCSQCRAIKPKVDQLREKYPNIKYYQYNTDIADDIAQELGVREMPTFHIFKDGDVFTSVRGAQAKELESAIEKVLAA